MDFLAACRVFVRLAERGSFSAVAREEKQSQPTISRRLSELEEHLGARLIARTTRSFSLTDEGRAFLAKAREVLRSLEEAEQSVGARAEALSGRLRLFAPVSLGRFVLVPRVSRFMEKHDEIDVDLVLSDDPRGLGEAAADLALVIGMPRRRTDQAQKLGDVPMVVCGAPALIGRAGTPRTVDGLADLPAIAFIGPDMTHESWRLERGAEIREVMPNARLRTDSSEAALAALIEGVGIGLVPLWLVRDAIERSQLWRLLPQWTGGVLPIHAVYPDGRPPNARTRAFIEHFTRSLKGDRLFV